jgi:hypothetical protein
MNKTPTPGFRFWDFIRATGPMWFGIVCGVAINLLVKWFL